MLLLPFGNGRNTISLGANFKFGKSSEEVTTEDATQLKKEHERPS